MAVALVAVALALQVAEQADEGMFLVVGVVDKNLPAYQESWSSTVEGSLDASAGLVLRTDDISE